MPSASETSSGLISPLPFFPGSSAITPLLPSPPSRCYCFTPPTIPTPGCGTLAVISCLPMRLQRVHLVLELLQFVETLCEEMRGKREGSREG